MCDQLLTEKVSRRCKETNCYSKRWNEGVTPGNAFPDTPAGVRACYRKEV